MNITKLTVPITSRLLPELGDSGLEAVAKKEMRRWRREPTSFHELFALAALRGLPQDRQMELRQLAQVQ